MSKPKYKDGKQIKTILQFERSTCDWYRLHHMGPKRTKTVHRAFLISWQYQFLKNFINKGWIYEAKLVEEEKK